MQADDYAVVLLDVLMPGMDGFETATLIRRQARSRDVPIVFLTAGIDQPEQAFRSYATGAVDYLAKLRELPAVGRPWTAQISPGTPSRRQARTS